VAQYPAGVRWCNPEDGSQMQDLLVGTLALSTPVGVPVLLELRQAALTNLEGSRVLSVSGCRRRRRSFPCRNAGGDKRACAWPFLLFSVNQIGLYLYLCTE